MPDSQFDQYSNSVDSSDVAPESRRDSRSNMLTSGNAHSFVELWVSTLRQAHPEIQSLASKDWETVAIGQSQADNVLSFRMGRNRLESKYEPNKSAYFLVNGLVDEYCFVLSLPRFYEFLRAMTAFRSEYKKVLEADKTLDQACHSLVKGYWNAVRPGRCGPCDVHQMSAEEQLALAKLQQATDAYEETAVAKRLDPQHPFKQVKEDLGQILGSRPSATPGLGPA